MKKQEFSPKLTTEAYRLYKNINSNEIFMISELIDNSIASYTQNDVQASVNGLKMEIFIDDNERIISFADNASGFTDEDIKLGIQIGVQSKKQGGNWHNKGLKHAAFWSGTALEIETIAKADNIHKKTKLDLDELDRTKNGNVSIIIEELQESFLKTKHKNSKFSSGSIITFSNIYQGRWNYEELITVNKNFSKRNSVLIQVLGKRFANYLNQGMEIILNWITESDKKKIVDLKIEPIVVPIENMCEYITYRYEKDSRWKKRYSFEEFKNEVRKRFMQELKSYIQKNQHNIHSASFWNNKDDYINELEKGFFDEERSFKWKEKIALEIKGKKVEINSVFGFIKKYPNKDENIYDFSIVKWKGISFSQFGRNIISSPNWKKSSDSRQVSSAVQLVDDHPGTPLQPYTRIFGEVDFDPLCSGDIKVAYPDDNKRDFIWNDFSVKDEFHKKLDELFKNKIGAVAFAFHMVQSYFDPKDDKKRTKEEQGVCVPDISNDLSEGIIRVKNDEISNRYTGTNKFINYNNVGLTIDIRLDNTKFPDDNLIDLKKLEENEYYVTANLNSPVWQHFLDETEIEYDEKKKLIEKLTLLIAICEINSQFDKWNEKSVVKLLNEIEGEVFKNE